MDEKLPESGAAPISADANPYNVDHARERRLRFMFIGLIAGAFILAALLLLLGFIMDAMSPSPRPPVDPAPVPSQGIETKGTSAGRPTLVTSSGDAFTDRAYRPTDRWAAAWDEDTVVPFPHVAP